MPAPSLERTLIIMQREEAAEMEKKKKQQLSGLPAAAEAQTLQGWELYERG